MEIYRDKCTRQARELFKDHVLEVMDAQTLIWHKPGMKEGRIEYRKLTPNLLSIAGDYGHAEFLWQCGEYGISFESIAHANHGYILEKLVAAPRDCPRLEYWDKDVAYRVIEEHVSVNVEELRELASSPDVALDIYLQRLKEHTVYGRNEPGPPWYSEEHWTIFMDAIAPNNYTFDGIDFEEMYDVGTVPHMTFYIMIEGLRMALAAWNERRVK